MNEILVSTAGSMPKNWALAALALRVAISGFFLWMAYRNLSGDPGMAADFERWGYPAGFRQLIGWLQVLGALALIAPQTCLLGGALLLCVLLGALATHLRHDSPMTLLSPLVFIVLICVALVPYRPLFFR